MTEPEMKIIDGSTQGTFSPVYYRLHGYKAVGLIDTEANGDIELYLAAKNKHNRVMVEYESFLERTAECIRGLQGFELGGSDLIIYPQSSMGLARNICGVMPWVDFQIPKRTLAEIQACVADMDLMKDERASIHARLAEMQGGFQIHKMKANQRKRFEPLLFNPDSFPKVIGKNVLVVDDSAFTGSTVKALADIAQERMANDVVILTLFWCSSLQKESDNWYENFS